MTVNEGEIAWYRRLGAPLLQKLLTQKLVGDFFFQQLAKPQVVRKILLKAYKRPEAVSDELIDILMKPATDPGAADVFVAFTSYFPRPLTQKNLFTSA